MKIGEAPLQHLARERRHFHRQLLPRERRHDLRLIRDDDEAPRGLLDDLLAQQRSAAAFDQAQPVVDRVGAVDGEIQRRELRERKRRDA